MHLKSLKLAGFKSFVEPTVVPFSSQLVAVVGPNGCGKSNIIDAVRWVMGESSAKNLRGESMVDVIFKGSSQRKSVGQASVELIFDNQLGRLSGQYGSYQEISVKRLVTRDGDSSYYLNGARCRRRDITDIFLGTGAGARGYSIIGQDTISRLIEARPEELRAYLEEAAGVSKYKERRRETLQRMTQTRENLARVLDIREELAKQLIRLERQAKAAERYRSLQEDARSHQLDILALRWRSFCEEQATVTSELESLSRRYELGQSTLASLMREQSNGQIRFQTTESDAQQAQLTLYQIKADMARLDESMQHHQRERQRIALDMEQSESEMKHLVHRLSVDAEALIFGNVHLEELEKEVMQCRIKLTEHQSLLAVHERQKKDWEEQWQIRQTRYYQEKHDVEVHQIRFQQAEERYQQTQVRLEHIEQAHASIVLEPIEEDISGLQEQRQALLVAQKEALVLCERAQDQSRMCRDALNDVLQQLHQAQDTLQGVVIEQAALTAAQRMALGSVSETAAPISRWSTQSRVAEIISVSDAWIAIVEWVLADGLQAIVCDSTDEFLADLDVIQGVSVSFARVTSPKRDSASYPPRLSDKVDGLIPFWIHDLDQIFAVDTLSEALAWLPSLEKNTSIVTRDGYWFGSGWMKVLHDLVPDESSLLSRQNRLAQLADGLLIERERVAALQLRRDELCAQQHDEQTYHSLQADLMSITDTIRICEMALLNKQEHLAQEKSRILVLRSEKEDLMVLLETISEQKMEAEQQGQVAMARMNALEIQENDLKQAKSVWELSIIAARQATDEARSHLHQLELAWNKQTITCQQYRDSIDKDQKHLDTLNTRLLQLHDRLNEWTVPDQSDALILQEKVQLHHELEQSLLALKEQLETDRQALDASQRAYHLEDQQLRALQEQVQKMQMQEQGLAIRASTVLDSLGELGADVALILSQLSDHVTLQQREQALVVLEESIQRLGAVNLVAIEEYQTELQRKTYLDEQHQDLMDALHTLDSAIAKMDKETELRLKETFEQVNASFQVLFPRLFGGGHARLELTCDNLLEAGIMVMAQPPGKRNSTIYLLSGGEKAMTAIALVFAIFQLNPSPFCMLDEVDAPLDELNVRRFCDLVKEMSQYVQFLFITHNKVTMELAEHLIGVTMREPGVSRVVSVDVNEALGMSK